MNKLPGRKQMRLKNYNYSSCGYYFVTICTNNRQSLFGKIDGGKMYLNDVGNIIDFTWSDLVNHNNIKLHEYVIMPDHFHGIIEIDTDYRRERSATVPQTYNYHFGVPEIIRQFKTFSSKRINEYLKRNGLEPFPTGGFWQKSYYEHIIRDEYDYKTRVEYTLNNPLKYELNKSV